MAPLLNLLEHLVQSTIVAVELSLEVVPLFQSGIAFGSSCISFVSCRIPFSQSVVAFGHGSGKLTLQEVEL